MATGPNRLERRASLLAQKMADTSQGLAHALGAGERPAFTTAMTRSEALAWWRQHISDDFGRQVLAGMTPEAIMRLHLDLQQSMNAEYAPPTEVPPSP